MLEIGLSNLNQEDRWRMKEKAVQELENKDKWSDLLWNFWNEFHLFLILYIIQISIEI